MAASPSGNPKNVNALPWVGVNLPNSDPHHTGRFPILEFAVEAERLGFNSVWAGDHLAFNSPWVDSTVTLATVSSVTNRIGLGYSVLLAALRQPVVMAKQLASLQIMSGDRLLLGVGVGGENAAEWNAAGVPMTERGKRTDVFLDALPALLSGTPTRIGAPYDVDVPALLPAVRQPPLFIGGRSDHALARAARTGSTWLGMWMDAARIRASSDKLKALTPEGSSVPEVALTVFVSPGSSTSEAVEFARRYVETTYNMPYEKVQRWVLAGPTSAIADGLTELSEAGVSGFLLSPLAPDFKRSLGDLRKAVGAAW